MQLFLQIYDCNLPLLHKQVSYIPYKTQFIAYLVFTGKCAIEWRKEFFLLFNCYLAAPRPTLGFSQEDSLTKPMLINAFKLFHQEPCNEVGSLSMDEHLVGLELQTFQF